MADVVIALGSNLGDSLNYLHRALLKMRSLGTILKIASLYKSSAYGFQEQPDFLNTVIVLSTKLKPLDLLKALKKIEMDLGRTRTKRWGPREIDLDIILYDQLKINSDTLTIPHPDFHNRNFVLLPLSEIASELTSPVHKMTVSDLLEKCGDETQITLLDKSWYTNGPEF
jgi:2-amino-4-hydroxy-6-hydroxymethyldihydropteridine diphosphokinase